MNGRFAIKINCLAGIIMLLSLVFAEPVSSRIVFNMNTDWAFHRGDTVDAMHIGIPDSTWIPVVLPHVMQLEQKHCGGNIIYDGQGWYRRLFTVGNEYKDKRITLQFEGVMKNCIVWLNGEEVGRNNGGYIGFTVDLTGRVKFNEPNLLAVRVDASDDPLTPPGKPQGDMDFYYYSGIYRDVRMLITDRLWITDPLAGNIRSGGGVFVSYPEVSSDLAKINVSTHIRSLLQTPVDVTLVTDLYDDSGNILVSDTIGSNLYNGQDISFCQILKASDPKLWYPDRPALHTITSRLIAQGREFDRIDTRVGIRKIEWTVDSGFLINGTPLYLRGANRHQAFPYIGDAAPNSMQVRDARAIKRGGYNSVRAAHYPNDPAFLDACDSIGLTVVECIPGWQYYNPDSLFSGRVKDDCRRMIRRDRNHPSVILWETALNETRYPVGLAEELYRIAHSEYPGSGMWTAGDYFGHKDMAGYFDVLYKQVDHFPEDGSVMTNSVDNLVALKPVVTREWGDGVGDKPRASLAESDHELLRQCFSRMSQLEGDGYFDWCMLDANPRMAGHYVWSYNDYARGSQDETMKSGVVDMNRYPKPVYHMLRSMLLPDVSGPFIHAAGLFEISSDSCVAVVFSNCDEVRITTDRGELYTMKRSDAAVRYPNVTSKGGSPLYLFPLRDNLAKNIRAEGVLNDGTSVSHVWRRPGNPHHIEIMAALDGVLADDSGCDLVPVYAIVCDSVGTRVPSWRNAVDFHVQGGLIPGDSIERIGINPQIPEGGVAFVFVRPEAGSRSVTVRASSVGLISDEDTFPTVAAGETALAPVTHTPYRGKEDDGAVVKPSTWQQRILGRTPVGIAAVSASGAMASAMIDGDDETWWIAPDDELPAVVTVDLGKNTWVAASRIMFQKDSSSYAHRVETSDDGHTWHPLYERECTGWDFKPITVDRELRYFRLIIDGVSEGRAGVREITLF